jgi:hypothetical protein
MRFREKEFKIGIGVNEWLNLVHQLHADGRLIEYTDKKSGNSQGYIKMKYGFDQPKNYHDTPNWDVIRQGFCWRVRKLKEPKEKKGLSYAFKQVLKSIGRLRCDGSLDRMEYKRLLRDDTPAVDHIKEAAVRGRFESIEGFQDSLKRVFRTDTERYDVRVKVGSSESAYIEMSFDKGFLETENGCVPFCLIELEAKGCTPEELRAFKQEVFDMYPKQAKEIHYSHADLGYSLVLPEALGRELLGERYIEGAHNMLMHPGDVLPKSFCLDRISIPHQINPPELPSTASCTLVVAARLPQLRMAAG